jgi:hypothetical protein
MNSKKWIKIYISIGVMIIALVGSFNYLMDPMWLFSHKFALNQSQTGFNERQQKTNILQFGKTNIYNGVLLGSSRSTFINQNDFVGMDVFNYSSASMEAFEYIDYIEFFKKKHKNLNHIIIGADFYNTNMPKIVGGPETPNYYINNSIKTGYRFTSLLSKDALRYSITNIKNHLMEGEIKHFYDRENIRYRPKVSEKVRIRTHTPGVKARTNNFIGREYKYNHKYIPGLSALKSNNPNINIIIFTTPISADLLVSIIKNGNRLKEYRDWLNNLITIFGSIYHFMDINSITTNLENYADPEHYYPYIGTLIANKISGFYNSKIPDDFGLVLNKGNLDEYLNKFEKKLSLYSSSLPVN